jgi:uncharacterized protein
MKTESNARLVGRGGERLHMRWFIWLFLSVGFCLAPSAGEDTMSADYEAELARWHATRLSGLTKEDGYLSLVGLHWISTEPTRIPSIGTARVEGTVVKLSLEPGFTYEGKPATELDLDLSLPEGQQTVTQGTRQFYAIQRGPWIGLRVKDSEAPTRVDFKGVNRFPADPTYRIEGRLLPEDLEIEVASVVGVATGEHSPGWAAFQWQGKEYKARLIGEPHDQKFFLVFSDETAGKTTYSACRFLSVERKGDDGLLLDFNKSINPACAFTPYATCPLPPEENIFPFPIPVGERTPE